MRRVLLTSARCAQGWQGPTGLPLRMRRHAWGLDLLAASVEAPVLVVDRPTREGFARLLERQRFDAVGIELASCDVGRARDLARLVRLVQPQAHLLVGGPGAGVEDLDRLVDFDERVLDDGIGPLRRRLGEDESAPVRLPTLAVATLSSSSGRIPLGMLVAGTGEGPRRKRFFEDGSALFAKAVRLASALGTESFLVPDQGFLADPILARGMAAAMEREGRALELAVFARCGDVAAYTPEELVRLGVFAVFLAPEDWRVEHAAVVRSLRAHGIVVHASCVVTPDTAQAQIDAALSIDADAIEVVADVRAGLEGLDESGAGKRTDSIAAARSVVAARQGSALVRIARTLLDGYRAFELSDDPWMLRRAARLRARAEDLRFLLDAAPEAAGPAGPRRAGVERDFACLLGPRSLCSRALFLRAQAVHEIDAIVRRVRHVVSFPGGAIRPYRWVHGERRSPWAKAV